MRLRIVPFVPGLRPTDEETRPGLGASDRAAFVTGEDRVNCAVLLVEVSELPEGAALEAGITVDGTALPGWEHRRVPVTDDPRQRVELWPEHDLAALDLGVAGGLMSRLQVEVRAVHHGEVVAVDTAELDVCDLRQLGSLYRRVIDRVLTADTTGQAARAGVPDPGVAYHPWYPVLRIGGDKAALYTAALVADIVDKERHLSDPAWLLRVGVYLELLTCLGIAEAVRDVVDLLEPAERAAYEHDEAFAEIRRRIRPDAWREVWERRSMSLPRFGSPRLGPVSVLNLLRKRDATLHFLHAHHEDLKHAMALAGHNGHDAQETWQRVFRDAERAVLRQAASAFPELGFLPQPARDLVLWQRLGVAGQQGVYPTAGNEYRASMNAVASWARQVGLIDYSGEECVPIGASLLAALVHDPPRVRLLQRHDGLGPDLAVTEPAVAPVPTTEEIERLLAAVPIFAMMTAEEVRTLALVARPLLLGPTERLVVQGSEGASLFLVGEGAVEVRLRKDDGTDWLVETMGPGEVVGEMALLTGESRAATVRSVEEAVVYEIDRQHYEPLLLAHPEWLEELARIMDERLARRRLRIAELDREAPLGLRDRIFRNFFG
ncbi:cyclic nucleotide-binding domain-containing protein [Nocardioides stalactiti]|uniref:cyclic nucleotide-binding domain-containing protein n=1 Tax=Nocardioides stalactiti TaxID=2755356 RepID=UPI0015FEE7CC|nr:cyclic nucleotide-binding domain-containing protein [Nocardioides stalactiti]